MIYIENPITFFENVETLIKKMWRYVEERQDEDQGLLFSWIVKSSATKRQKKVQEEISNQGICEDEYLV